LEADAVILRAIIICRLDDRGEPLVYSVKGARLNARLGP
jgi:hypothetical protein